MDVEEETKKESEGPHYQKCECKDLKFLCNTSSVPKKKFHVLWRRNSSETNEPRNHPKHSVEPPRSGGVHITEILNIGPELVMQWELKEKKFDL